MLWDSFGKRMIAYTNKTAEHLMRVLLSFLVVIVLASPLLAVSKAQPEVLEKRIALAASYLKKSVKDSGRFVYNRDLAGNETDSLRYNFLRHAGTLYAMALYAKSAEDLHLSLHLSENIRKSAQYLINCCLDSVDDQSNMLALWSRPLLTGKPQAPLQAKLGGTGLALAALIQVEDVIPGTIEIQMLREMGNFLLFMQNYDGSFVSKYYPDSDVPKSTAWQSLYYPGEAVLGLIMLYEIDSDLRWLEAAIDALRYLARKRENQKHVEADHWALLATERLFRQDVDALRKASPSSISWIAPKSEISIKTTLTRHAEKIVQSILLEQIQNNNDQCLNGGFSKDGRIAPTATRLEGLLATLNFLPSGSIREQAEESVKRGIKFLLNNQITEGPNIGGFSRFSQHCRFEDKMINEIRIDYVQHALGALLSYREMQNSIYLQ